MNQCLETCTEFMQHTAEVFSGKTSTLSIRAVVEEHNFDDSKRGTAASAICPSSSYYSIYRNAKPIIDMSWKFSISRATTLALALALCLGLMQFAMAQSEVEVRIG